jgi:sugar lactone lactonase YvrE
MKKPQYLFRSAVVLTAFLSPIIAFAAPDDLFEADAGSGIIYKFTPAGVRTTFASGLNAPAGLAFDVSGNLFVAELGAGTITKITRTGTKTTFASGLSGPGGVAFDAAGNLFEGDSTVGTITKITPAGTKSTFTSGLNGPGGLAFDRSGNLFEPDQFSGSIYKFTPAGTRTTFATLLQRPIALAFDGAGNLFESDRNSGNIFKFTPAGMQTTFASGLNRPVGLAFDSSGNLFAGEQNTGTINKFTPGGTKTPFASGLNGPQGLAVQPGQLTNISTRLEVLTGNSVLIAGFIISGTDSKQVLLRALGPTLTQFGVVGALADTTIELHNGAGAIIATNDNWKDNANQAAIMATGKAPPNDLESAILITLAPGNYSAVVRGKNGITGVALAEIYDLDQTVNAVLTNISTRGFVDTGVNVMIGGLISSSGATRILARTLGPTLSQFGVPNVLADPTLELHDANGVLIASNDNWKDSEQAAIMATGKAPPNDLESAIIITKPAGSGTAIVRGKNNTTGNALVEVYTLPPGP